MTNSIFIALIFPDGLVHSRHNGGLIQPIEY